MKTFRIFILVALSVMWFHCGENFEAEGEAAFNAKDYTTAIGHYKNALPTSLNKEAVKAKLALSYFYRGEDLYSKTRNVKAFAGNFNEGQQYLPDMSDEKFNKEYSRILFELGQAYSVAPPGNELEKDEFYNSSLNMLGEALFWDVDNKAADSLIQRIRDNSFQELLDKANKYFDRAAQTGKVDLYLSAETYLKKAAEYKANDPGVLNLFKKLKKRTLAVLNYQDGVSLAIMSYSHEKDGMLMRLTIKNYLSDSVALDMANFHVIGKDGERYLVDEEAMRVRKLFGEDCMENVTLNASKPFIEGKIIIAMPENVDVGYLAYKVNRRLESRKYFP